jgi:hypothetical protein
MESRPGLFGSYFADGKANEREQPADKHTINAHPTARPTARRIRITTAYSS